MPNVGDKIMRSSTILKDSFFACRAVHLRYIKVIELTPEKLILFGIVLKNNTIGVPINNLSSISYFSKYGTEISFKLNLDNVEMPDSIRKKLGN